jgi:hypothetical protein
MPNSSAKRPSRRLQASYRNALKAGTDLYYPLASREAVEAGVLKLRDELAPLRRGTRRWAAGVAALLVVIAVLVVWLVRGQDETKKAVADMTSQVAKGGESLEKIAQRFEALASRGGLVAAAQTPEEHYHNARVHELGGNFTAARKEYAEYLSANLEALDPWLSYSAMLKASEGRAGAAETLRHFASKLEPRTVSYQTALALLEEGDARLARLEELAGTHPDFGPLPWLISQEYSEASAATRRSPTSARRSSGWRSSGWRRPAENSRGISSIRRRPSSGWIRRMSAGPSSRACRRRSSKIR